MELIVGRRYLFKWYQGPERWISEATVIEISPSGKRVKLGDGGTTVWWDKGDLMPIEELLSEPSEPRKGCE